MAKILVTPPKTIEAKDIIPRTCYLLRDDYSVSINEALGDGLKFVLTLDEMNQIFDFILNIVSQQGQSSLAGVAVVDKQIDLSNPSSPVVLSP